MNGMKTGVLLDGTKGCSDWEFVEPQSSSFSKCLVLQVRNKR